MKESKTMQFVINNNRYTFDITYEELTRCGRMWFGVCRANNKEAWLDEHGVQFIGEHRQEATKVEVTANTLPNGYALWGGQPRDALPHGARYYTNRR